MQVVGPNRYGTEQAAMQRARQAGQEGRETPKNSAGAEHATCLDDDAGRAFLDLGSNQAHLSHRRTHESTSGPAFTCEQPRTRDSADDKAASGSTSCHRTNATQHRATPPNCKERENERASHRGAHAEAGAGAGNGDRALDNRVGGRVCSTANRKAGPHDGISKTHGGTHKQHWTWLFRSRPN